MNVQRGDIKMSNGSLQSQQSSAGLIVRNKLLTDLLEKRW